MDRVGAFGIVYESHKCLRSPWDDEGWARGDPIIPDQCSREEPRKDLLLEELDVDFVIPDVPSGHGVGDDPSNVSTETRLIQGQRTAVVASQGGLEEACGTVRGNQDFHRPFLRYPRIES